MSVAAEGVIVDPAVRQPFGLPMGTIRGVLALLICGFVWMVLLLPQQNIKLPLAHFFLASMVFMAFVSHPGVAPVGGSHLIPWILRVVFAVGSVGVLVYAAYTNWSQATDRLQPNPAEFSEWWLTYIGVTFGGFLVGRVFRLLLGNGNMFFQTVRAWLSVLALLMMAGEFLLFIANVSDSERRLDGFLHFWQAVQLAAVSAYFASRT